MKKKTLIPQPPHFITHITFDLSTGANFKNMMIASAKDSGQVWWKGLRIYIPNDLKFENAYRYEVMRSACDSFLDQWKRDFVDKKPSALDDACFRETVNVMRGTPFRSKKKK